MRTSPGCLPCKRRRKRCDLGKPICIGCQRNFLICAWNTAVENSCGDLASSTRIPTAHGHQEKLNVAQTGRGGTDQGLSYQSFSSTPIAALQAYPNTTLHLILKRPGSQFLFSHFINRTAPAVSTLSQGANPFLQILLPVAMRSDMVLQGILALSGIHCLEEECDSYSQSTWEHYAQALRALKYGLTKFTALDKGLALPLSICTLLFCFMEVTRGDTEEFVFHHLKATRNILLGMSGSQLSSTDQQAYCLVLEWYSYLLTVSTICDAKSDDDVVEHSSSIFMELLQRNMSPSGVLFGCAHELFCLIPQVMALSKRIHTEHQVLGYISTEAECVRASLLSSIQEWNTSSTDANCITAGRIYQLALIVLLQADSDSGTLQSFTDQLPNLLQLLPVGSSVTTTLCWPLGIIGSLAQTAICKNSIRGYLSAIYTRYRFKNLHQTLMLLETLWAEDVRRSRTGAFTLKCMMEEQRYYILLA